MKSDRPKVLFDLCGWPLVRHVVETAKALSPSRIVVVVGHGRADVESALADEPAVFAHQKEQLGTGHAVRQAKAKLGDFAGDVLVLLGDVPLVRERTLADLLATHRKRKADATILSGIAPDPTGYGRVLRDEAGNVVAIREHRDATAAERAVAEVNTGILAFRSEALWPALRALKADNSQGEYYLTDVPARLIAKGMKVAAATVADFDEVQGVNSLADLARIGAAARRAILDAHMERGVRIHDPATTFVDRSVTIGEGTTIFPFTVITGDVEIGKGCEVGPFSHLRSGARLADGAQIGNFVEVKKSVVGAGSKAKHLAYLGDATIGAGTNIGCGTITANYDGKAKHRTWIGDGVHVGSGTVFVAPVRVGHHATTGAGAIVLSGRDVADGETVVGVPARPIGRKGASA